MSTKHTEKSCLSLHLNTVSPDASSNIPGGCQLLSAENPLLPREFNSIYLFPMHSCLADDSLSILSTVTAMAALCALH